MSQTRLFLVGDDEALELLAELARHLPLLQLARVDDPPETIAADDVIVIGATHPRLRDALLRKTMTAGNARRVAIVPEGNAPAGARAILAAADLVRLLVPGLGDLPAG